MREDRRKRYDDGFRHEALGLIKAGAGKHFLARRLAMPVQTAEKWIMKYRSNGEDAVMGAKGKRSYDWGTKVAAARDHVCVLSSCYRPVWREFSFRKSGRF